LYRFARAPNDFADEGDLRPQERLALLAATARSCAGSGRPFPESRLFRELGEVVAAHRLRLRRFTTSSMLSSRMSPSSATASSPSCWIIAAVRPIPSARLMLHLYGQSDARKRRLLDAICSALQLINFWQDVEIDFRKNRIFIPQEDMARFGVSEDQIGHGGTPPAAGGV